MDKQKITTISEALDLCIETKLIVNSLWSVIQVTYIDGDVLVHEIKVNRIKGDPSSQETQIFRDEEALSNAAQMIKAALANIKDICNYIIDNEIPKKRLEGLMERLSTIREISWDIIRIWKDKGGDTIHIYDQTTNSSSIYFNCMAIMDNIRIASEMTGIKVFRIKPQESKKSTFRSIIQHPDKDGLLKRLHELIDEETSEAMVGAILLRASGAFDSLIKEIPTKQQFDNEFPLFKYNNWQAIHNYMSDNNQKALDKANKIVIFEKK